MGPGEISPYRDYGENRQFVKGNNTQTSQRNDDDKCTADEGKRIAGKDEQ